MEKENMMSGSPEKFWETAQQIHSDMEDLVRRSGIPLNIVPVKAGDPAIMLQITKANFTRLQDAINVEAALFHRLG